MTVDEMEEYLDRALVAIDTYRTALEDILRWTDDYRPLTDHDIRTIAICRKALAAEGGRKSCRN